MNSTLTIRRDFVAVARAAMAKGAKCCKTEAGAFTVLVGRPPDDSVLTIDGLPVILTEAEAMAVRHGN